MPVIALLPLVLLLLCADATTVTAAEGPPTDRIATSAGPLDLTFLGHGTLMLTFKDTVLHVDPYGKVADYAALPRADLVLLTHDHADHLDQAALALVRTPVTDIVLPPVCADRVQGGLILKNGETRTVRGITVTAVPAYNLVHRRDNGQPFHPRGAGNGYLLDFGDTRLYVAGDTENTPEMAALKDVDIAFLPMNLPYTMTPEMVADAARSFRPRILYPYHYGDTDPQRLVELLRDQPDIEVRIRPLR
ncbi:MBL fold metallo-hydrolase [uncultured Desulfobulbus sp.]|uniref:MBL fold metallo-hydrolase n=1 Tax=uncultured Desulfobulbus sp. TaxID=239745 RepID=UPI002625A56D|nr:MBL fold metallo-hydrolase [uncultured Desulfobulbus sp.]